MRPPRPVRTRYRRPLASRSVGTVLAVNLLVVSIPIAVLVLASYPALAVGLAVGLVARPVGRWIVTGVRRVRRLVGDVRRGLDADRSERAPVSRR